jgi:hypothetical protein
MCLFCSMTRRQAFRGLTAAAVGGAAQRLAVPAIRSPLAGVAGFAALAAADASPGAAAERVILGEGRYRYRVVEGWGALPPGSPIGTAPRSAWTARTTSTCSTGAPIP